MKLVCCMLRSVAAVMSVSWLCSMPTLALQPSLTVSTESGVKAAGAACLAHLMYKLSVNLNKWSRLHSEV